MQSRKTPEAEARAFNKQKHESKMARKTQTLHESDNASFTCIVPSNVAEPNTLPMYPRNNNKVGVILNQQKWHEMLEQGYHVASSISQKHTNILISAREVDERN